MSAIAPPQTVELSDGATLSVELLHRPVAPADQLRVADLLATEWERTDVDWFPSLRGAYADTLTSVTAIGRCGEDDVGTATVAYPRTGRRSRWWRT